MNEVSTIGLDVAKNVFQVHGVDAAGTVVIRRSLRRAQVLAWFGKLPRCLVGVEACASAHYWARQLQLLGHEKDQERLSERDNRHYGYIKTFKTFKY